MVADDAVWVGADPGGKNAFGVAVLRSGEPIQTWCVSCAVEAVDEIASAGVTVVSGAGVDAPLWWSSGPSGGRRADQWLRTRYSLSGGNVQPANSLRGAALVQGAMFVEVIRNRLGVNGVTETHPKALLRALGMEDWCSFSERFDVECSSATEHARDAAISAVAAREGFCGRWENDLSLVRDSDEQDPATHWLAPVHYFWPE